MTRICSLCNKKNDRPDQRYCHICHADYMKTYRIMKEKHGYINCLTCDALIPPSILYCEKCMKETRKDWKFKIEARNYTTRCIKKGLITRKNCEVCGDENSVAHHINYERPLEIIWLCRSCHVAEHKKINHS